MSRSLLLSFLLPSAIIWLRELLQLINIQVYRSTQTHVPVCPCRRTWLLIDRMSPHRGNSIFKGSEIAKCLKYSKISKRVNFGQWWPSGKGLVWTVVGNNPKGLMTKQRIWVVFWAEWKTMEEILSSQVTGIYDFKKCCCGYQ